MSTFALNKDSGYPLKTVENNDGTSTLLVQSASAAPGLVINSWTREVINVGTTPIALSPDVGQIYIRIVPLADGNFSYGPDAGITATNTETFTRYAPIEIQINNTVYVLKHAATGDVVVYRGSA